MGGNRGLRRGLSYCLRVLRSCRSLRVPSFQGIFRVKPT